MKRLKKTAALIVSAVLTINLFTSFGVSADEAVSISTVNEFKDFTEKCVYDEYSKNKKFVLQNDIDLEGEEIKCAEVFCGIFEGGGHSIKNLSMSFEGSDKGLFASVMKGAEIRDLNVQGEIRITEDTDTETIIKRRAADVLTRMNIETDETTKLSSTKAAGGIAGYNEGKIINCSFSGKVNGKNQVGGIVGFNTMTGIIDSCTNGAAVSGDKEVGGIAGYNEGRVKLSKNTGTVCADADENTVNAGGITGNSEGAVVICTNEGAVGGESFGDNIGGISGKQSGEIRECINNGYVQGRRSIGGICGRFEPYTDIDLSYESAKAAIDKQIDIFNDDVEDARKKIIDYATDLLDGKGWISEILERLGIKEGTTSSRLDRLTNSAVRMMDSVSDTADSARNTHLAESAKDTLNSISDFSDEAKTTVRDLNGSIDETLTSINDFLDEFDGKGQEISDTMNTLNDTLDNLNSSIDKGEEDVDEIKDRLFTQMDDLEADLDDIDARLNETHSSLQSTMRSLRSAGGQTAELFDDLDDSVVNTQKEVRRIKDSLDTMRKNVSDRITDAKNRLHPETTDAPVETYDAGYNVTPDEQLDNGYDVRPSVASALKSMVFTTAYAAKDDEEKTAISDLKSTDIVLPRLIGDENADTALIRYSINNGEVSGMELSGGVAGSIGFESAIRTGDSITLPNGTKVNADSILKAVVDACVNYGNASSKNDYVGGAVGKCDIGDIKNTLSTGEIKSEEGSYAGGIAGYCEGEISNCIAINDIEGESYIGGIAGSGKDIKTSYALPRLDKKKDKSGAIAGFASGEVTGTYFIDEGLSGINGTNLEGKAEAVAPEDIAVTGGKLPPKMPLLTDSDFYMSDGDLYMPQIKALAQNKAENISAILQSKSTEMARFHFNVVFIDKDKELRSMVVDYGTVLSDSDIPRLTADGSEVPAWDKDVHAPIIRHTKFTAEYNKAATTISSGEEPPLLLVESIFDDGTAVTVIDESTDRDFTGYTKGAAYSFSLNKSAYDVIKVHVRDEKGKTVKIAVEENGRWTLLDCERDGSYAVFTVGAPCKFVMLERTASMAWILIIIAAAILLGAAGFITYRKVRKKDGSKEEENI